MGGARVSALSSGIGSLLADDEGSVGAASTPTGSCPSVSSSWGALPTALPRILIVSRRHMRKAKFVDFVGEWHLELILRYGACPVIVPRCVGPDTTADEVTRLIDAYEPIHGVLLCEGEDIDLAAWPGALGPDGGRLSEEQVAAVAASHPSDAAVDVAKDLIEFELVRRCTTRGIPYLGICRGSQVLNVYRGGSIYSDIDTQVGGGVRHIDYANYDSHRHPVTVTPATPLADWFDGAAALDVNSYHHQGVRTLASGLSPMALSPDGLVEAFYEPATHDPDSGRYTVGLQFHPERMQDAAGVYDYPGCVGAYEAFGRAVRAYARRAVGVGAPPEPVEAALEAVPPPVAVVAGPSWSPLGQGYTPAGASAVGAPSKPKATTLNPTPAVGSPAIIASAPSGTSSASRPARNSPSSPRTCHKNAPPPDSHLSAAPTVLQLSLRVSRAHSEAIKSFDAASALYRTRRASEAAVAASLSRGASLLVATASPARSLHATVHGGCAARDALGDLYGPRLSPAVEALPVDPTTQLETAVVAAAAALARMSPSQLADAADMLRSLTGVAARLQERGEGLEGGGGRPRRVRGGVPEEEEEARPQGQVATAKGVKA